MIAALLVLLGCQVAGEAAVRAVGLALPGPVLGLAMLLAGFALLPRLADMVRPLAQGILGHMSLLFVPAGVGVVGHLDRLGPAVLSAVVVSTVLAIAVGALVFAGVARLTRSDPADD